MDKNKETLDSYYAWVPNFSNLIYSDQIMELTKLNFRDQIDEFLKNLPDYCATHNSGYEEKEGCSGKRVSNSNYGNYGTTDNVICDAGHCYPAGEGSGDSCTAKQSGNSKVSPCSNDGLDPTNYSKFD